VDRLAETIASYIIKGSGNDFPAIAQQLFEYQYTNNLPYQRLCNSIGTTPSTTCKWREIPAVPALAFRRFDLSCKPLTECVQEFHSSGTTSGLSSKHWMDGDATNIYDVSLKYGFTNTFKKPGDIWAVMMSANDSPHSSLSYMLSKLGARHFANQDLGLFACNLTQAVDDGEPITLFGTAFGLYELSHFGRFPLPHGSCVIETGGFKGRYHELARPEFYAILRETFGLQDDRCFSEYGMCEMASQFYSQGEDGALYGPHWVGTRCINPLTNTDAAAGEAGLLLHVDLANFNSVAAIQTQDKAILLQDGGFKLIGRATDAELRGCSLTAEELWSK
jgi:hypothetical protein